MRSATDEDTQRHAEQRLIASLRLSETGAAAGVWARLDRLTRGILGWESDTEAAIEVAGVWDRLTGEGRRRVTAAASRRLAAVVPVLAASGEPTLRAQAASLAGGPTGRVEPAVIARLALDDDADVRRALGSALWRAVGATDGPGDEPAGLDRALAAVARVAPSVREPETLGAVLMWLSGACPRRASALQEAVEDPAGPASLALRGAVRRLGLLDAPALVRVVRVASMAPAALDVLERRASGPGFGGPASAAHLLRTRARRAWLGRERRPGLTPTPAALASTLGSADSASAWGAAVWCEAVGAWEGRSVRVEPLADRALSSPDARARWRCVWAWARAEERRAPAVRSALEDLVFDREPRVARTALTGLSGRASVWSSALARRAARSPHAAVRALAGRTLERADPWAWLAPGATGALDAAAAVRALARDREGVVGRLRQRIARGQSDARVRAIGLALRLWVAREVEIELLTAAGDADARVAATAVAALGRVGTDSAEQALVTCLSHPDARARANALEALARCGVEPGAVRDRIASGTPRERGNAALALARLGGSALSEEVSAALEALLTDARPGHRLSGLWLAGRLGRVESASRVAALASPAEPEPVRRRARLTARRLLAQMRQDAKPTAVA